VAKTELEKDGKCQEEISKAIKDILNFFFDGASGMDSERLKRFFLILYTRRAHENFKDHEKVAESLKNKLRQLRDAVNEAYAPLGGSFAEPHRINVKDNSPFKDNVPITKDRPSLTFFRILTRASYAREIKCSAGITVVRRVHKKLLAIGCTHNFKMFDLVLVMLYLGSFAKCYYVMEDFLEGLTASNCHGNLTVRHLELMKEKFGTWVGGLDHRGGPTSVDVIAVYSNEEAHQVAIDSLKTFAVALESSDMALLQFKEVLVKMVASLPGIDLFYGQNLGLYLALCGYLK
jgi:hypothetical protein